MGSNKKDAVSNKKIKFNLVNFFSNNKDAVSY